MEGGMYIPPSILFLQLVMPQLVTFLISLLLTGMGSLGQTQPIFCDFHVHHHLGLLYSRAG